MSESPHTPETPPILLNEADNPVIQDATAQYDPGYPILAESRPLRGESNNQGSLQLLLDGKVSAIVTGIDSTTADVVRAAIEVIGPKDGLVSSFFSMEKEGQPSLYLGDCGVVPKPDRQTLTKIAEQTAENVRDLGVSPRIAFLKSEGEPGLDGALVEDAAQAFGQRKPEFDSLGPATWRDAKKQGANTFIFPNLDSGNIVYKVLHDKDGGGWQAVPTEEPGVNILKKADRTVYLSKHEAHTPDAEALAESALKAWQKARADNPNGDVPVVALLSFSTDASAGQREEVKTVQAAYEILKQQHPDLPVMGPVQWDSAREPAIYTKKTGKPYPGEPSVFIFPNRDSADIAYDVMQEPDIGGRTAVGPVIQGLKNDVLVVDLSRGATSEDVKGAIHIAALKSGRAKLAQVA